MSEVTKLIHKYLRHEKKFPHVWCPGCGNGIVLGALIRAIDRTGFGKDDIVLVSGIGCSGRMSVYVDFNTLHTTHGRALTFATGVKLANPRLQVIVVMGDGDATAIGGNHFIHAARRNLNLTAIIINNNIYGMTGGQYSPTTPYGARSATSHVRPRGTRLFHQRDGRVRRGRHGGPGHGLSRHLAGSAYGTGHQKTGFRGGGGHQPLPHPVRGQK